MRFNDIAAVAGKSGLYKILKPTKTGVILESIDEKKSKLVAGAHQRVSVLDEISIYTTDKEGSKPLKEIYQKIKNEFGTDLGITPSSDTDELKSFLKHVLPNYDESRVYASDMKKLVSWYLLLNDIPGIFEESDEEE